MRLRTSPAVAVLASTLLLVAACGEDDGQGPDSQDVSESASPDGADDLLAEHGLEGLDARQIIEKLDAAEEPPAGLTASVGYDELVLTDADSGSEVSLPLKRKFYLSVAPYVDKTTECHHRSLTTDTGELVDKELRVLLIGMDGEIIATNTVRTNARGFVGFWLQRDIDATLQMSYDGRTGHADISTHRRAPTCLTTLRLR